MRHSDHLKRYFSSRSTVSTWWKESEWPPVRREYLDEGVKWLRNLTDWDGKSVLDVGTGFGRLASVLTDAGASVCGLDLSLEMLQLAKEGGIKRLIAGDAENLPVASKSFDAAICVSTLMHVPCPPAVVHELARAVRPGGLVVIGITNTFSFPSVVQNLQIHATIYRWLRNRKLSHTNTIWEARGWIRDAGLQCVDELGIGLFPPTVVISLWPGKVVNPLPHSWSSWCLAFEKKHQLERSKLRYFMAGLRFVAKTPI